MARIFSILLSFVALSRLSDCARAEGPPSNDDYRFVLSGMRNERLKVRSGLCRITGRRAVKSPRDPSRDWSGPVTIFAAFDGDKVRFDRTEPGWVVDPATARDHPGGEPGRAIAGVKRQIVGQKFYDDGKKAGYWSADQFQINVVSAQGDRSSFFGVGYFDVRGLGLYRYVDLQRQTRLKALFDDLARAHYLFKVERTDPDVWLLRWVLADVALEVEATTAVDVRNGFTPVRFSMRQRNVKKNEEWFTTQEETTKWASRNGVWVPVSHSYSYSPGVGAFRDDVSLAITWEKGNEPIDPGLFHYDSFDAPDGVGVVDSSLGRAITVKPTNPPAVPRGSTWRFYALLGLGVLASVAVAGGAYLLFGRRRATI